MVKVYIDICSYKNPVYLGAFFICIVIQVLLTSAPLFGYSSLLIIFKEMKFYQQLCPTAYKPWISNLTQFNLTNNDLSSSTTNIISCDQQDKALNLPFAIGVILHSAVKVFIGRVIDYTGAKTSQYIGCIFLMMFGISFAYTVQGMEYLLFVAFLFLSISSSFLTLCPYQVVNVLYKKHKPLFLSILSGSIDGSTVIFIIFLDIYQKGFSLGAISIGYVVLCTIFLMVIACALYPTKEALWGLVDDDVRSNLQPKPDTPILLSTEDFAASFMSSYNMYCESIQKTLDEIEEVEAREALLASLSQSLALQWSQSSNYTMTVSKQYDLPAGKPYGTITEHVPGYGADEHGCTTSYFVSSKQHGDSEKQQLLTSQKDVLKMTPYAGLPLWRYIFSWLFILHALQSSITMLKIVYFIANLDKYLLEMTDLDTATTYIKYFGYIQFSGVLVAPLCSFLFVKPSKKKDGVPLTAEEDFLEKVKILILPSFVLVALSLILTGLQLIENLQLSIPIFIIFLVCNSLMWCLISLYPAFLFPAKYYCTMIGINNGICGFICFIQYPLLALEKEMFYGRQFNTNAIFMALLASTVILPLYLWYFYRKSQNNVTKNSGKEGEEWL